MADSTRREENEPQQDDGDRAPPRVVGFSASTARTNSLRRSKRYARLASARLLVSPDLWFVDARQLSALALELRLPTMHNLRQFTQAGVLMVIRRRFLQISTGRSAGSWTRS
jgi:hypothetical protein